MRRVLAFVMLTIGWLGIFLGPLLAFYATPRVEKAEVDVYDVTKSRGTGSYYSVQFLGLVGPTRVENISIAKGNPAKSTHTVAVIGIFSRTRDLSRGDFDYGYSVYAFNRSTGYGVNCCGAKPVARGLTLKFPFHTQKRTYPFWDSSAKRAFPARYVRTDRVDGLDAYVFESTVPATPIMRTQVPGGIVGQPGVANVSVVRYYRAETTLWVEPFTGAILRAGQHNVQWFADPNGTRLLTLADVNILQEPGSVAETADRIRNQLWQLKLVSTWLPIGAPIAGVALILGAALLFRSEGASRPLAAGATASAEPRAAEQPGAPDEATTTVEPET